MDRALCVRYAWSSTARLCSVACAHVTGLGSSCFSCSLVFLLSGEFGWSRSLPTPLFYQAASRRFHLSPSASPCDGDFFYCCLNSFSETKRHRPMVKQVFVAFSATRVKEQASLYAGNDTTSKGVSRGSHLDKFLLLCHLAPSSAPVRHLQITTRTTRQLGPAVVCAGLLPSVLA